MFNYHCWLGVTEPALLQPQCQRLLCSSGFTIINFTEHYFTPYGYTALWLLAESHAALHTFPEQQRSYLELSSCVESLYLRFRQQLLAEDSLRLLE